MRLLNRQQALLWRCPRPDTMDDLAARRIFFLTFHGFTLETDQSTLCGLVMPKRSSDGPVIGIRNWPYVCRDCERAARSLR